MQMRYFNNNGVVYGYDDADPNQAELINNAVQAGFAEVTGSWPPGPSLDEVKALKLFDINVACGAAIVAGFDSASLGTSHHYTASLEDQANLAALVQIGFDDDFTCVDQAGVKAARLHTVAQLRQVLIDGATAKKAHLVRARSLKDQIAAIQPGPDAIAIVSAITF